MIGRGDDHRVDVLAIQDAAKVLVGVARADPVLRSGHALRVHVAHCSDRAAWVVVDAQEARAAPAAAHQRRNDPLARGPALRRTDRTARDEARYGETESRAREESSPAQLSCLVGHRFLLKSGLRVRPPRSLNVLKPRRRVNQVRKDRFAAARQGGFGTVTC